MSACWSGCATATWTSLRTMHRMPRAASHATSSSRTGGRACTRVRARPSSGWRRASRAAHDVRQLDGHRCQRDDGDDEERPVRLPAPRRPLRWTRRQHLSESQEVANGAALAVVVAPSSFRKLHMSRQALLLLFLIIVAASCGSPIATCSEGCPAGTECDAPSQLCTRVQPDAGREGPGSFDGGQPDAGALDAGSSLADAGAPDAGRDDAGSPDAGVSDAGPFEPVDAGPVDAGTCTQLRWFPDSDGDGFGASSGTPVLACAQPASTALTSDDCDDASALINPAQMERCDALRVDEDCDGVQNENCSCVGIGSTRPCCAGRGAETCEARDGGSSYSACSAARSSEICNGLDDDCNEVTSPSSTAGS
jgi:hypothetical protein